MPKKVPRTVGTRYLKKWDIVDAEVESPIQGQVKDPEDLYLFLKDLENELVPKMIAVYLDDNNQFMGHQVFLGQTPGTFDTAHLYHYYLIFLAKKYMLLTNHPQGDAAPTEADCAFMDTLVLDSRLLSFKPQFADYIIVGDKTYYSMATHEGKACMCGRQHDL